MRCYHHNDMDGKAAGYEVYITDNENEKLEIYYV